MTEEIRLTEGVMAEEIRVVEHYSASILNKVGEGARVLAALRDAGVNLIAFWGYKHGAGRAQLEFCYPERCVFEAAVRTNPPSSGSRPGKREDRDGLEESPYAVSTGCALRRKPCRQLTCELA